MKLVSAIASAYESYVELEMTVSFSINEKLQNIAPDNIPLNQVAFKLVKWAEAKDRVSELLVAVRQQYPKNKSLATLEELLVRSAVNQPGASAYQPPDSYSSCLASQRRPFIDRRELRKFLLRLSQNDGARVLTVNGATGLGK